MKFERFWCVLGAVVGSFYAVSAFHEGLHDHQFLLFFDCMIAAVWFHGAAKSYVRVKRWRQKNNES